MMKPLLLDMVVNSYIAFGVVTCGLHITNNLVVCVYQNKNSCISSLDLHYLSRGIYPISYHHHYNHREWIGHSKKR